MILLGPTPCHGCKRPVVVTFRGPRTLNAADRTVHACTQLGNVRGERCTCGGWIIVNLYTDRGIEMAVQAHQQTPEHRAWWANGGFEQRRRAA